ncbi:MAG: cytochrome c oxidase assembly protein [Gaiellaceae bacterium]
MEELHERRILERRRADGLVLRRSTRSRQLAVALPVWAVIPYVWHVPFLYEAAVRHSAALEHVSFFTAGLIVWLPVLETLPAPEWFGTGPKLAYIAGLAGEARARPRPARRQAGRALRPGAGAGRAPLNSR